MRFLYEKKFFTFLIFMFTMQISFASHYEKEQQIILHDINQYRLEHGLRSLQLNPLLSNEATKHSQQMANEEIAFGHLGFRHRMQRILANFHHAHGISENVAYTYLGPNRITQQWINSPPHKRNILGNYNLTGIGVAYDEHHRIFVTQIFLMN